MSTAEKLANLDPNLRALVEELVDKRVDERVASMQGDISALAQRLQSAEARLPGERVTLIVFSNDLDRLMTAFILATGSTAMGLNVTMYFTFWGISALKRRTEYSNKGLLERAFSVMLPSNANASATSKLNFGGLGPVLFKKMMKDNDVESLPGLMDTARELGVKMVACRMTMGIMGISDEELIDGIEFGGVASCVEDALQSRFSLLV